ncbi:hypothetical protein PSU4_48540 [Pseudonocardia sulfidoxydans NBRC 16205]|uniref:Uncharacterized protein n=1 Tax=Pseudonocardia sulfidoxydans NBRC 16205 TaxID=1223511 RepID=A0A511DM54_9PSEU|nr:hypothetical protein PSU4_48540 [Pseudonocardia sulfidoxydans NBRC 16205]
MNQAGGSPREVVVVDAAADTSGDSFGGLRRPYDTAPPARVPNHRRPGVVTDRDRA